MRILLVNDYFAPLAIGGAEVVVASLAAHLQRRGHIVAVVTSKSRGQASESTEAGIPVLRLGHFPDAKKTIRAGSSGVSGKPSRELAQAFQAVMRSFSPDVIHFHNLWLLGPSLLQLATVPAVLTVHDYWPFCLRRVLVNVMNRECPGPSAIGCRLCQLRTANSLNSLNLIPVEADRRNRLSMINERVTVTVPSVYVANRLIGAGIDAQTVHLIRNGVDPDIEPPPPESRDLDMVLYVGRISPFKGLKPLVAAFKEPSLETRSLHVAGGAQEQGRSSPNVHWLGRLPPDRLRALYRRAGCVVIPSLWPEPAGLVALEAMRAGAAVVATSRGGLPEVIKDGIHGRLVERADPPQLAAAIHEVLTDPRLRRSATREGPPEILGRFSATAMTDSYERLFRSHAQS